jgi:hypothetical protein
MCITTNIGPIYCTLQPFIQIARGKVLTNSVQSHVLFASIIPVEDFDELLLLEQKF